MIHLQVRQISAVNSQQTRHLTMWNLKTSSDVTIIETEIVIFYENRTESISRFFWASVTRLRYCIALNGTVIGTADQRMGFISLWVRSRQMQRSLYLQLQISGQKIEIEFFIKIQSKLNREENHNYHITKNKAIGDSTLHPSVPVSRTCPRTPPCCLPAMPCQAVTPHPCCIEIDKTLSTPSCYAIILPLTNMHDIIHKTRST